jgi:hypothetical protein
MNYYFVVAITLLILSIVRIAYINGIVSQWNYQLAIYIERLKHNPAVRENYIDWIKKQKINRWKYYLRLNAWSINDMINDPFLKQEIEHQIKRLNKY